MGIMNIRKNYTRKRLLAVVLILCLAVQFMQVFTNVFASTPTAEEYFQINNITDTTVKITGYDTAGGLDVVIPETINGKIVTSIDNFAFMVDGLTSVTIPNSVESIGYYAFSNNQLTSVTIPDSVTNIGFYAFSDNQLTSVTIPDSVPNIGAYAFSNNQLTSVKIPDSVTRIEDGTFQNNQLTSLTIPDSVTNIGGYAFKDNQLTSVTIPAGVTSISTSTFQNNQLTSVMIPDNVTSIGSNAFKDNQLTNVTIPDSVTSISSGAFQNNQLTSVTIPNGVTDIGNSAFANNQLMSVEIPDSVTSIGVNAFKDNQLTSVTIPGSVTSIGEGAFNNNQLESVTIPDSVSSIKESMFANNQLKSVTIPNRVTDIGNSAFVNNQLMSVEIPASVTSIGVNAFRDNQLTSVTIQGSVTVIGEGAFEGNQDSPIDLTIRGYSDTEAEAYASSNFHTFVDIIDAAVTADNHYTVDDNAGTIIADQTAITTDVTVGAFLDNMTKPSEVEWKVVSSGTWILNPADFDHATGKANGDSLAVGDRLAVKAADDKMVKVYEINVLNDLDAVVQDKGALTIGYEAGDSATNVTQNITLATSGVNGTTITWESDKLDVIDASGKVTRPSYIEGDATVTLTATISKGTESERKAFAVKTFMLTVKNLALTDAEVVALDKEVLAIEFAIGESATSVMQDVYLPTSGANGTTISWDSNQPGVIDASGKVTRPSHSEGDATVTLTAMISKGTESETKTFTLTVLAQEQEEPPIEEPGPSNNTDLSSLSLSGITLNKAFSPVRTRYSASAANSVQTTTVTATVYDSKATLNIFVNGTVSLDGKANLNVGSNTITVEVTAEDGITRKAYTILVTRQSATSNSPSPGSPAGGGTTPDPAPATEYITEDSVTVEISLNGGSISLGKMQLNIPKNALGSTIKVTVAKLDTSDVVSLSVGEKMQLVGDVYEITKDKSGTFNKDITITMPFDPSAVDTEQVTLGLFWYNEVTDEWIILNNIEVNMEDGTVSGDVNHFTKFAVLAVEKTAEQSAPTGEQLTDIAGHWAEHNIAQLVAKGVISGYPDGTFKPERNITRAEFVSLLVKALQLNAQEGKVFEDTVNHWTRDEIATAYAYGIINGYESNTFAPDDTITREQMAVMIVNALHLGTASSEKTFVDQTDISSWAKEAVLAAVDRGIMTGYADNTLKPGANATRAEAVTVILRALEKR